MTMTGNRGFGEWADIFGDAVVATALLDRLCATSQVRHRHRVMTLGKGQ